MRTHDVHVMGCTLLLAHPLLFVMVCTYMIRRRRRRRIWIRIRMRIRINRHRTELRRC